MKTDDTRMKHAPFWTVFFSLLSLVWIFPVVLVLINSFKQKAYISRNPFLIPSGKSFVGIENYTRGIERTNFIASFGWTLFITVGAVALIHHLHVNVRMVDRASE